MWPGGKDGAGVAQRLINQIPPHDVFVSAFLGDCAVMRRLKPASLSIGIDLDRENIDRWAANAAACGVPDRTAFFCCDAVEWLRHRFGWYHVAATGDGAPVARPTMLAVPASSSAATSSGATRWFVYADPPYMLATRKSAAQLYKHEMSDAAHVRLLETLRWLPCLVMVSHYPCDLYSDYLAGWRSFKFRSQTRGGSSAVECVWCNYPEPTILHDSRYLGRDKREREKIRRRVRRALGKVQRLPPLERQAVLDALARP